MSAALSAQEVAIADALFALLCDCPSRDACEPNCQANENYARLGSTAIAALLAVPTDQRTVAK